MKYSCHNLSNNFAQIDFLRWMLMGFFVNTTGMFERDFNDVLNVISELKNEHELLTLLEFI